MAFMISEASPLGTSLGWESNGTVIVWSIRRCGSEIWREDKISLYEVGFFGCSLTRNQTDTSCIERDIRIMIKAQK